MSANARLRAALAIGALLVVLTGCTTPPESAPPVISSLTPSASLELPAEVLPLADGDCTQLIDPAVMAAELGGSTTASVGNFELQLGLVGGIGCVYTFGEQGEPGNSQVSIKVAPSVITDAGELEGSLAPEVCAPDGTDLLAMNPGCDATLTVGGWWYTLSVDTFNSAQEQRASFEAITATLEDALNAAEAPTQKETAEPFECQPSKTGILPTTTTRGALGPENGAISLAAFRLAGPVNCDFATPDSGRWYLVVYPGGASAYDACTHPASLGNVVGSSVTVPGVDTAFALPPEPGRIGICATDGASTVQVWRETDVDVDWDEELLATAGALVVPAFAAAD